MTDSVEEMLAMLKKYIELYDHAGVLLCEGILYHHP